MKNSNHMSHFRVGPIYVITIFLLTVIGVCIGKLKYFSIGIVYLAKLPLLINWLFLTIVVKKEEVILERIFGQEYLIYKSKVNRCIPWFPSKHLYR